MTENCLEARAARLQKYIARLIQSTSMAEGWHVVCDTLGEIGFDRILYGRKMLPTFANLHNFSNTILLSTYGDDLDKRFLKSRLYLQSPTVLWLMHNYGLMSWGETAKKFAAGELPDEQAQV
jgi:hypothetical protein